jgi:guanylate kinase
VLRRRLGIATEELQEVSGYDYVVVNDDLEDAVRDLGAILDAESRRVIRQHELLERVEAIRRDVAAAAAGLGK